MRMQQAILYFGSFNPVHNGHIALAKAVAGRVPGAQVWFVLSAQNPFKQQSDLWPEALRETLLKKALESFPEFTFCGAELELPRPSYTIQTLNYLKEKHPDTEFSILMGEDNLAGLHKWKEFTRILEECRIWVYPRGEGERGEPTAYEAMRLFPQRISLLENLPLLNISSTLIRERIKKGESVAELVPWPEETFRHPYD